jgi:hypothetical protein
LIPTSFRIPLFLRFPCSSIQTSGEYKILVIQNLKPAAFCSWIYAWVLVPTSWDSSSFKSAVMWDLALWLYMYVVSIKERICPCKSRTNASMNSLDTSPEHWKKSCPAFIIEGTEGCDDALGPRGRTTMWRENQGVDCVIDIGTTNTYERGC